jgi:hypothetical protein
MRSSCGVLLAFLLAAAPAHAAGAAASAVPDACSLLKPADIAAVQEAKLVEAKNSAGREGGAAVAQCFFLTEPAVRSISLRWVTAPRDGDADAARARWRAVFHGEREDAEERDREHGEGGKEREEEEHPPLPVKGLGEEAFWTGGPASGALYVLAGETFLRISIGGVSDPTLRIEKTKKLATAALRRLPSKRRHPARPK